MLFYHHTVFLYSHIIISLVLEIIRHLIHFINTII